MSYTQISYLLGFIIVSIYIILSYWKKSIPQLPDAIILLLATTSIPPCIRVIYIFFNYDGKSIKEIGNNEQFYIIVGAFSVIWLSINEIFRKFKEKISPQNIN